MMAIKTCHCGLISWNESPNKRMNAMNNPPFTTVAIKEVITVGAPSYTSGVQKWKGAADTLNDMEQVSRSRPVNIMDELAAFPMAISSRKKLPLSLAPYKKAMPNNISPVENAPIRKYFSEASLLFKFRLSLPVSI